jgi:Brp/Blh family beta-carotene 15,15'-monooxygenase
MTTTLRRQSRTDRFQESGLFWPVVAGTVGVTAVAAATSFPNWVSIATVVTVIAVLGIPHGAVDHLVVERIDGPHDRGSRARFVVAYVLAMAVVGLVWLAVPPLALVIFLALSVHHFGQSDLAYLRLSEPSQLAIQWSRGLFLVGLPLVAHITSVAPVVERLGGGDPASWPWLSDLWWFWVALLVVQHTVVGVSIGSRMRDRAVIGREVVTVAALTLMFLTADPLIGFAVYFGLWHSVAHLLVLTDLLGNEPLPLRSVARLAAPLTAMSLAALAAVAVGAALIGRPDLLMPVALIFVSMLTLPHMVVVERLWRRSSSTE